MLQDMSGEQSGELLGEPLSDLEEGQRGEQAREPMGVQEDVASEETGEPSQEQVGKPLGDQEEVPRGEQAGEPMSVQEGEASREQVGELLLMTSSANIKVMFNFSMLIFNVAGHVRRTIW